MEKFNRMWREPSRIVSPAIVGIERITWHERHLLAGGPGKRQLRSGVLLPFNVLKLRNPHCSIGEHGGNF